MRLPSNRRLPLWFALFLGACAEPAPDGGPVAAEPLPTGPTLAPAADDLVEVDLGAGTSDGGPGSLDPTGEVVQDPAPHLDGEVGTFALRVGVTFVYPFDIVAAEGESDLDVGAVVGPPGGAVHLYESSSRGEWTWTPTDADIGHHALQIALLQGATREILDSIVLDLAVAPRESLVEYGF